MTTAASPPGRGTLVVALTLLTVAAVRWRQGSLYEGALDPVVMAKAALTGVALLLALGLARRGRRRALPAFPAAYAVATAAAATVGAIQGPDGLASTVLVARFLLLGVTLYLLAGAFRGEDLLDALARAFFVVAVVSAGTGMDSLASGRLHGGMPALHSNELALLVGFVALHAWWQWLTARAGAWQVTRGLVAAALVLATGSRGSLAVLLLGALVALATVRRVRVSALVAALVALPVTLAALVVTDLPALLARGQSAGELLSLTNRVIAWRAALTSVASATQLWFGEGAATRTVAVSGQYWATQVIDSSPVSSFVQSGLVGFAIGTAWIIHSFVYLRRTAPLDDQAGFRLAGLTFIVVRAVLESGLLEASCSFIVFGCVTLAAPLVADAPVGGAAPHPGPAAPTRRPGRRRPPTRRRRAGGSRPAPSRSG